MRWLAAMFLGILFTAALAGCRNQRSELIESELRTRDNDLVDMREQNNRLRGYVQSLEREVQALRHGSSAQITVEEASQTYTIKTLNLGRQTGGLNDDNQPGDEALQVVLEPLDPDNHAIKAPGTVTVQALQVTPEGVKLPLCSWQVKNDQLRRAWRTGWFATGYYLVLPWNVWPTMENMRVVVRLTLSDGRFFEKDKDIKIRLAPAHLRKVAPSEFGNPPPPGPAVPEIPNQPRLIEPSLSESSVRQASTNTSTKSGSTLKPAVKAKPPEPSPIDKVELLPPVVVPY